MLTVAEMTFSDLEQSPGKSPAKFCGTIVEVHCENCTKQFTARLADRRRGWAKFCSKRCKASEQERRTGQFADYLERGGF